MQLTARAFGLLLGIPLCLAFSAFSPVFQFGALAWSVAFVAIFVADWGLTPKPNDWLLTRHHDDRLSLAADNRITIRVLLRAGYGPISIWLRDEPPASFRVDAIQRTLTAKITPGIRDEISYTVYPPRRGDYQFGDMHIRWQSLLGLMRRQTSLAASAHVKVYPNLAYVKKYDLLLRRNRLWEMGLRTARLLGNGTEFERLRDYLPDDEYRRIDWKATARRGKPISVEYQTERSQNIIALLDIGRMMRSPVDDVAKLDFAVNAVLLLAYVALHKGDRVGLLTFADAPATWIAPRSGKGQFHHMLDQLYSVSSQAVEPDYDAAFGFLASQLQKRSLVLVFTDLTGSLSTDALVAQLARVNRRHMVLLVTVRDADIQQLAIQTVVDSNTLYQRTVAEQLLDERRLTLERLRHRGINTLDVSADKLSIAVINRYLELKMHTQI